MAGTLVIPNAYEQAILTPKELIVDETDFIIWTSLVHLSPTQVMTFVHTDIYYWSPTVWRRFQSIWPSIRRLLPPIVYASGDVCDAKWCKFVERLGFVPVLQDCPCSDGTLRPIYAHFKGTKVPFEKELT